MNRQIRYAEAFYLGAVLSGFFHIFNRCFPPNIHFRNASEVPPCCDARSCRPGNLGSLPPGASTTNIIGTRQISERFTSGFIIFTYNIKILFEPLPMDVCVKHTFINRARYNSIRRYLAALYYIKIYTTKITQFSFIIRIQNHPNAVVRTYCWEVHYIPEKIGWMVPDAVWIIVGI